MQVTYFFDPSCPFTWRTSRWLVSVAAARGLALRWRSFSLSMLNGGGIPDEYKPVMVAAGQALRLVEALHAAESHDRAGAFYTELGNRTHESGTPLRDDIVVAAAEAAGVTDPKAILGDPSWDAAVRASHELAYGSAGPDVGSPVLWVEGADRAVHGPVLGLDAAPGREESLALWDAVLPLARSRHFFELKRGRG
jgi:2-hydroxychromene-2-carboxylate isomerase